MKHRLVHKLLAILALITIYHNKAMNGFPLAPLNLWAVITTIR